ncbi:MAG: cation transporter [Erysipelotrichaceae bacterium]|nr:cation transporter [Erysipelotrichaceae bacterium]
MTEWLIRHFISSPDDVHKDTVRLEYGKLSSMTGIVCNILLFIVKFGIGMFSGAIAVTGDAFNNLTDAMACLITMFGYYFAARPADKDHPFGHGRLEYIFTQAIVFMIFAVGGTLLYNGVIHIMHPAEQTFHPVVFTVLLITIGVKFWLSRFNMTLGRKIDSVAMIATAADSRNDVLSTAIAALSMLLAGFVGGLPFDGIAAVLVALYILWSGFGIAKDVYSRMLGKPADRQLSEEIISILSEYDEILDVHDVIIHDYGSGVLMGSAHVGMDQEMRFVDAHDIADKAETEIRHKTGVQMLLHMDPVDLADPRRQKYEDMLLEILHREDERITVHDLRLKREGGREVLACDVLLPFDADREKMKKLVSERLAQTDPDLKTKIHYEHGYVEEAQ